MVWPIVVSTHDVPMNRTNLFGSSSFFKPATSLLGNQASSGSLKTRKKSLSLDGSDNESGRLGRGLGYADDMDRLSPSDQKGLTSRVIPLISLSRSPSRSESVRSGGLSEDEGYNIDEGDAARSRLLRDDPSHGEDETLSIGRGRARSKVRLFQRGGLGQCLFGTDIGAQVYVGLLVFWVGGCQFGLLLMNRFILWTGTYKWVRGFLISGHLLIWTDSHIPLP